MLKTMQIPVIFETERLDTSQMDGEFFLAMLGANSQAESEMTSNRIKWGVQAAFRRGEVRYQYKRLGYRKGEDGEPEIIPEEAKIVKQIYE
jgi:DNA invertase Pin-like site-specific DNA recombinase